MNKADSEPLAKPEADMAASGDAAFGVQTTDVLRHGRDGQRQPPTQTQVIREEMLTLDVAGVGQYALMWTPTADNTQAAAYCLEDGLLGPAGVPEPLAMAAGFAFTEGLINGLSDIAEMAVCPERTDVVRMRLTHPEQVLVYRRNVVMTSSCGVCGAREQLDERLAHCPRIADTLRVTIADLTRIGDAMQGQQTIFATTGGAHGAAIFTADLNIVAVAEDIGRHNALDKVIGHHLLSGQRFAGCGAFISSRISYEMIAKATRAGFEIVAAISAPTSLAIGMAARAGITLCCFVRRGSAEIYTHPQRIIPA
jgi:FdhD protein